MKRLYYPLQILIFLIGAVSVLGVMFSLLHLVVQATENVTVIIVGVLIVWVVLTSIVWRKFFYRSEIARRIAEYEREADRLYSKVRKHIKRIRKQLPYLQNRKTAQTLYDICNYTEIFLQKTQEKNPNARHRAGNILGAHMLNIERLVIPQYLEMEGHPIYLPHSEENLKYADEVLPRFLAFLISRIEHLEESDNNYFEMSLMMLDPTQRIAVNRDDSISLYDSDMSL